jgi:deoxyhypusine synthase
MTQFKHAQYHWPRTIANVDNLPQIKGYDFDQPFDFDTFMSAYGTTGFQASHLAQAIEVVRAMRREKATIFFGFTSNMISSGIREIITYLVKHKHVHVIVTPAGGIEEDIIKTFKPFHLGTFDVPGEQLFDNGINRTGNIFVPNDRFVDFDKFMREFLEKIYEDYTKKGKTVNTQVLNRELGLAINSEESYLTWAARNNIPVVCPALMDGSFGDMVHFFRQRYPDFVIDCASDIDVLIKTALNSEKTGALILGAGMCKHYILNANIFREGLDYTVYINTSQEFDGSDSGARIEEAITWGKVKPRTPAVKVHADATIAFPLIVAATFARKD